MKSHLIKFTFVLLLSNVFAFTKAFSQAELKDDMQYIRSKFKQINLSIKEKRLEVIEFYNESAEGSKVVSYRSEHIIDKILVTFYRENGKLIQEYYFDKDGLIFVFDRKYTYNRPIYLNGTSEANKGDEVFDFKKSIVQENRYYFTKNKLIRWIDSHGIAIYKNEKRYQIKESIILEDIAELIKKLSKK